MQILRQKHLDAIERTALDVQNDAALEGAVQFAELQERLHLGRGLGDQRRRGQSQRKGHRGKTEGLIGTQAQRAFVLGPRTRSRPGMGRNQFAPGRSGQPCRHVQERTAADRNLPGGLGGAAGLDQRDIELGQLPLAPPRRHAKVARQTARGPWPASRARLRPSGPFHPCGPPSRGRCRPRPSPAGSPVGSSMWNCSRCPRRNSRARSQTSRRPSS